MPETFFDVVKTWIWNLKYAFLEYCFYLCKEKYCKLKKKTDKAIFSLQSKRDIKMEGNKQN